MMIRYTDSIADVGPGNLRGFFVGWPNPPSPETHLRLLENSDHIVLAIDDETGNVVGFITAISDGVLCAYIPLLEVLPDHKGQGIGRELTRRMLSVMSGLYMVDTICDPEVAPFYEKFGMERGIGMLIRRHELQSGAEEDTRS